MRRPVHGATVEEKPCNECVPGASLYVFRAVCLDTGRYGFWWHPTKRREDAATIRATVRDLYRGCKARHVLEQDR
jgi:hypothetical protein